MSSEYSRRSRWSVGSKEHKDQLSLLLVFEGKGGTDLEDKKNFPTDVRVQDKHATIFVNYISVRHLDILRGVSLELNKI